MQKNRWSRKFDWVKNDSTYVQQSRTELYDENRFIAVGDIYFKLNKYLTGVTFSYIISLDDIYNKNNLMTGDGYSIVNMYNEYDVIDRVMKNIISVDIAADTNIDINLQWFSINDVKLLPGHLVLLKEQDLQNENDIYVVDNNYFLENANILSSREKSEKFSCSVKLGKNADKQFFLANVGEVFPTSFEPKYFIEGKSFVIKNLISYNVYNTNIESGKTSKIIFTDYDVARKQVSDNYNLYDDLFMTGITLSSLPSASFVTINYHHDYPYTIRVGNDYIFDDLVSGITNINGFTAIPYPFGFDCLIGDYINLDINDGLISYLLLDTFIKDIQSGYLIIEDIIPNRILTELKNYSFLVENLNVAIDWTDALNKLNYTPYSDFFITATGSTAIGFIDVKIETIENIYNKYFDYDGLTFDFIDDTNFRFFGSINQYINYKLFDRLNQINIDIFHTGFTFFNEYLLDDFTYQYTDNNRIRLVTTLSGLTDIFKPYTYVYASGLGQPTQKTLIYSVSSYEITIEKPASWDVFPPPQITSIQNIDGLKNISDILYEVYMNQEYDWYITKKDNERKYIAKIYAELLTLNASFRDNITGILYENENNEFILKLYDLENDQNLYFSAIELIFIGSDRKSRLPMPLNTVEATKLTSLSSLTYYTDWDVLDDGEDDTLDGNGPTTVIGEISDSGLNNILPGINDPPLLYTDIDGGYDSILP